MKKVFKILGIVILSAVIGVSMTTCDPDDDWDEDEYYYGGGGNSGGNSGGSSGERRTCTTCNGYGECKWCKGYGYSSVGKCTLCRGNGRCTTCNGRGWMYASINHHGDEYIAANRNNLSHRMLFSCTNIHSCLHTRGEYGVHIAQCIRKKISQNT